MGLKVYRFVAHFGAASDGVISWARRPRSGLAPYPLSSWLRTLRSGAFGPLQLALYL